LKGETTVGDEKMEDDGEEGSCEAEGDDDLY